MRKNKNIIRFLSSIIVMMFATILLVPTVYGLGASPLRVEYDGYPGDVLSGQLNVLNSSDESTHVVVSKGDFLVNPDTQQVVFLEQDSKNEEWSMQDWITFDQNIIDVEPGDKGIVPYKITIPENVEYEHGYYGAVFVQSKSKGQDGSSGVGVSLRVAHLILLIVHDPEDEEFDKRVDLKLHEFMLDEELGKKGRVGFEIEYRNEGDVHTAPQSLIGIYKSDTKLELKDRLIREIEVNKGKQNVLPQNRKVFNITFEDTLEQGLVDVVLQEKDTGNVLATMVLEVNEEGVINVKSSEIFEKAFSGENLQGFLKGANDYENRLKFIWLFAIIIGTFGILGALTYAKKRGIISTSKLTKRRKKLKKK